MVSALNKTYGKSIFRTIRSSLSRFIAILAIVAFKRDFWRDFSPRRQTCAPLPTITTTRPACTTPRVVSTLGLTEDDLDTVREVEGVQAVMPAYDTDLVLIAEGEDNTNYTTRMHSSL